MVDEITLRVLFFVWLFEKRRREINRMKIEDPKKCGIGQGEKCCVFITFGPDGFECQKDGPMSRFLFSRQDMSAKRTPIQSYPDCQLKD